MFIMYVNSACLILISDLNCVYNILKLSIGEKISKRLYENI